MIILCDGKENMVHIASCPALLHRIASCSFPRATCGSLSMGLEGRRGLQPQEELDLLLVEGKRDNLTQCPHHSLWA